jgi:hypothetical protein
MDQVAGLVATTAMAGSACTRTPAEGEADRPAANAQPAAIGFA